MWWKDSRVHKLSLTYDAYLKLGSTIANSQIDKYLVAERLGNGAFGDVYKGFHVENRTEVAVKLLDLEKVKREKSTYKRQIMQRLCRTQSALMLKCNSNHVVRCYDVYQNMSLKIIVMEYCNGGTLQQEIDDTRGIPQKEAILILKQIINGIGEMHEKRIIHRDLKAENILSHNGVYKIADLGFSKQVSNEGQIQQTTLGTVTTMAPEVLNQKPYGLKADIWSIAVIFYQMVYGVYPFPKTYSHEQAYMAIKKFSLGHGPTHTNNNRTSSPKVTQFFRDLLTMDTSMRLGWNQILKHEMFKDEEKLELNQEFRLSLSLMAPQQAVQLELNNEQLETDSQFSQLSELSSEDSSEGNMPIDVTPLPTALVQKKSHEMKAEEDRTFRWVRETHLECLKTQLIYNEIVKPVEVFKLLNFKNRDVAECMYLLLTRCRNNMSVIRDELGRVNNKQLFIVKNLQMAVKPLYTKIDQSWNSYVKMLTEIENKFMSVISDKVSTVIANSSMKEKDIMLTGVEKSDYTRQQQVDYTDRNYVPKMMKEIGKNKDSSAESVVGYLRHYAEINAIRQSDLEKRTFREYVRMILH